MTLAEMRTELLGYLGDPNGTYTTTAEADTAFNLAQDILIHQLHWRAISDMCPDLIGTDTGTTTSGTETYALPSDSINAIALQVGGYTARQARPQDRPTVDGTNTWTAPLTTDPAFYIKGANYHIFPTPTDSITALSLDYVKEATRLSSDGDTTDFGIDFDGILINLATGIRFQKVGASLEGGEQSALQFHQKANMEIEAINRRYA